MATIPSGSQTGSSSGVSVTNTNNNGQSSVVTSNSVSIYDRVISINGLNGVVSATSSSLVITTSGSNVKIELPTSISASNINISSTQQTITGTTAGSIVASMPFQGTTYKKAILYLDAYENDSTTAQTYTFPTSFTNSPVVSVNSATVPNVSVTTTKISIAPDTTTAYTGWIVVEGY